MGEFLDELARSLAKPMPRSRALRLLGGAVASAAVPALRPRLARGAAKRPLDECDAPGRCAGKSTCGLKDPNAGPSPIPVCIVTCCDQDTPVCCKWPGYTGRIANTFGLGPCGQTRVGTVCCCAAGSSCGDPATAPCGKPKVCGPDITGALDDALSRVKSEFSNWSGPTRYAACLNLVTLPGAAISWDISELGPGGRERFTKRYSDCSSCGNSVQVGNDCHYSGSVNYVVYGVMMRLCSDYLSEANSYFADWFTSNEMLELIYMHKNQTGTPAANFQASNNWALAGYHSGSTRPTPPGDRTECKQHCAQEYSGPGLTVRWLPMTIRPGG